MSRVLIATPTLQLGDTGAEVERLQTMLNERVPRTLTVDGIFGEDTKFAVEILQVRAFLETDGVVGPETWTVLLNGGVGHLPTLRRGSQGAIVERLQRALSLGNKTGPMSDVQQFAGTRGYYFGVIDGDFGPLTEQAVKDFQTTPSPHEHRSLSSIDGIVGPETWTELRSFIQLTTHLGL